MVPRILLRVQNLLDGRFRIIRGFQLDAQQCNRKQRHQSKNAIHGFLPKNDL
jgi:hypothetical protein